MRDAPPPGVRYVYPPHSHRFAFAGPRRSQVNPFVDYSCAEVVDYAVPPGLAAGIHSSRLPVGTGGPWIVEVDCLVTTLRFGRPFACGATMEASTGRIDARMVRARGTVMLRFFLSDSCKGILFWSDHARRVAVEYVTEERLLKEGALERFLAKLDVVYPALRAVQSLPVRDGYITVLYMGRTFDDKGGPLAARMFAALADRPIRRVWVGPAPPAVHELLRGVEVREMVKRDEWLSLLREVDILVSPTLYESYGMALVEAAASGAALVTTKGPGMEHVGELFREGESALLIDNRLGFADKVAALTAAVETLIEQPELLSTMQEANRKLLLDGRLSLRRRDAKLLRYYLSFDERGGRGPKTTDHLEWRRLSAADVRELYLSYTKGKPHRVLVR